MAKRKLLKTYINNGYYIRTCLYFESFYCMFDNVNVFLRYLTRLVKKYGSQDIFKDLSIELVKEDIHTYKQDVINVTLKDILV